MPIDYDALLAWRFDDVEQTYDERDCILYALGLGLGSRPTDPAHLRHVYEDGLVPFPTMPVVMAHPGFWLRDPRTGVDWQRAVAAEQSIVVHRPLPPRGTVIGRMSVTEIFDKGAGKGALLAYRRNLVDKATGALLCAVEGSTFLRGDGGFGKGPRSGPAPPAAPQREPDLSIEVPTLPQAALVYRLTGDMNPLHADPEVAARAGFERPILHGLCSFGVACRALCEAAGGQAARRLRHFAARFSSPVYPGETLRTDIWRVHEDEFEFRCRIVARDVVVLTHGRASFDPVRR